MFKKKLTLILTIVLIVNLGLIGFLFVQNKKMNDEMQQIKQEEAAKKEAEKEKAEKEKAEKEEQERIENEKLKGSADLIAINNGIDKMAESYMLLGTIQNNTNKQLTSVSIDFTIFDSYGNQVDTMSASTPSLGIGDTFDFEIISDTLPGYDYDLATAYEVPVANYTYNYDINYNY